MIRKTRKGIYLTAVQVPDTKMMYVQGYDYDRSLKAEQPERSSGGEVVGQRGHHQEERSSGGEGVRQRLEVITL